MSDKLFTPEDERLLLDLLDTDTMTPLETGSPSQIVLAQRCYAAHASTLGLEVVHHEPPPSAAVEAACVPISVRDMVKRMGATFLDSQPNMVLRLGPNRKATHTIMCNFHFDTVAGAIPVSYQDGRFTGRGAVDMKGPGVALLAGIRYALLQDPTLTDDLTLLIQCVSGGEGGAMGVYGTNVLVEQGFVGRLNVFAEASGGYFFDHSTTSMTARIDVQGNGSTDDEPQAGHNATLLLGHLAQYFGKYLAYRIHAIGGKVCIAGLHTGTMHNRVYGSGALLINFAYDSMELAKAIQSEMEEAFAEGCKSFRREFGSVKVAQKTAAELSEICSLTWIKRGLPVLANRDEQMEEVLRQTGLLRNPDDRRDRTFTCDAMWAQAPGSYTIVYGPGSLAANKAHAEGEFIDLSDLEVYAKSVVAIIRAFRAHVRSSR
jgi:acetylornithine deacetylase